MFGVTLWEMFTYCEEPWFGLSGRQVHAEHCVNIHTVLAVFVLLSISVFVFTFRNVSSPFLWFAFVAL